MSFIGDFAKNKRNFSKEGYLYCKKIPLSETASRFFAFERDNVGLEKIPYLLVDSKCVSNGSLESLSTSYGIDDDTWERLLPRMHVSERCYVDKIMMVDKILENMPSVEKDFKENFIPEEHRVYIEQFLKHNKESKSPLYTELDDDLVFHNGEIYDGKTFNSLIENYILREWYFALGICSTDSIEWQLFSTNRMKKLSRVTTYKLGGVGININDCYDIELNCHRTSITDYQHFFGRGAMSANLSNCKIAIIGVGAIGSILLETLVRGGAKHISVWDGDNVEPGNICRSIYNLNDIGRNKTTVCVEHMSEISPFCCVTPHPYNLYGKYNYDSQEDVYKELSSFDIIFDCTASNELLHFLSYTFTNTPIVSICITNHAKDILCLCSTDGNPYYQRKAFLAMIEQDTQNFYAEGTGCYSPTFLATNSHISYLVNMYVADLFSCFKSKSTMRSVIYNCDGKNTNTDYLLNYKLESYNIILTIPESVIRKINLMPDSYDYAIGYLFGTYSEDGKQIFVCDAVCSKEASDAIEEIFASSEGIIDYIGEIHYSGISEDTYSSDIFKSLQAKAYSQDINSNNPLLAIRNPEGDISYFLFINNNLDKFQEQK